MCLFVCVIDAGVIEREPIEEFAEQYREQELPEGFKDGKSNYILWLLFNPVL